MRLQRQFPKPSELAPLLSFRRPELSALKRRLAAAHTIEDLRQIARRRTPAGPFDYTDGAADREISTRTSREAFDDLEFEPGVLRDVSSVDMTTEILGRRSSLPFGMAPTGFTRMMHSSGESAVASAAARAGIPYSLSVVGTTSIEDVAAVAPDAQRWFQLYLWKDRELSLQLVADARAAGYEALIVTVDVPWLGNRIRDLRNGMTIPPQLTPRTLLDASYRPAWWLNLLTTKPYSFAFDRSGSEGIQGLISALYDPSVTFDDLRWIRESWDGPILVKGIQSAVDAQRAIDHGADGVVLSNHGGRQLDRSRVPLHVLPSVVARLGGKATIMLDSGIRDGSDIVAAIALGADFTLVGRAYLYGLMAGGEAGVDRCIEILRAQIERTMALLGATSVDELTPDHVHLLTRRIPLQ